MPAENDKTGGASATEPAQTASPANSAAAKEPKFTKTRLRRDCLTLFGVTTSTFDGAMYGETGQLTVKEAKQRIEKWKGTPVVPAKKKEVTK